MTDDPRTLVSTDWLAAHLADPDLRILDGSYYLPDEGRDARAEYDAAHIPGARFFDIDEISDSRSALPHMAPPPEKFVSRMRAMGVGDGHQVVVYDGAGLFSAARVWWTFRLMGKVDVAVLDGGLPKWLAEGREVEDMPPLLRDRHITVSRQAALVRDVTQVAAAAKLGDHEILDARAPDRFRGEAPEPRPGLRAGHIPGSRNLHYRLLLNDDAEAMRATSLTHLTAVSGANLAIVIGGVLLVLHALRVGPRWRRRLVAATVVAFAFLTRFEPSVLRAGSMALLVLLVAARGMPRDARHALAGAVLLLVLLDPRLAGSLGLLLSATATAGVLVVAPVVERRLGRVPRRLRTVVAITIGAQVTVVPLLLTTFGEVPLASVPANVVAVPAAALAAVLSFLGSVLALVHLELGAPLFWLAGLPARVVLGAAHGFAGLGGAATLARPTTVVALVGVCAWVLTPPRSRRSRRVGAVALVALLASGVTPLLGGLPPRQLTVTAIDVGQGDAFLIESPGARILVDAGADDTAARWLRSHGRRRLDLVVVSHPHLDHVGGVPAVLRRLRVDAVWYRPLPTPLPEAAEVLAVAAERGIAVRSPVTGDRARVGDLVVEVLHPPPGRPYRWSRSELNDTSLVLRISHGDRRVLTTGDVEVVAQRDLLASAPGRLQAELVTTPHHGADTSDPAFLTALDPLVALISAGRDNPHGHPAPATIAHLDRQGVVVRRTDLEGTIRVAVPSRPAAGGVPSPPRHATVPRRLGHGEPGRHRSPGAIAPPGHRTSEGHRCPSS